MSRYKVDTNLLNIYMQGEEIGEKERSNLLIRGCPEEWFEKIEEIEKGKYIDWLESICRVQEITLGLVNLKPIDSDSIERVSVGQLRKESVVLSDDEAGQALIKEAKRRGFKAGAIINVSNIIDDDCRNATLKGRDGISYGQSRDVLVYHEDTFLTIDIYKQGNWAEVLSSDGKLRRVQAKLNEIRKIIEE